jgi:hypothetical protein
MEDRKRMSAPAAAWVMPGQFISLSMMILVGFALNLLITAAIQKYVSSAVGFVLFWSGNAYFAGHFINALANVPIAWKGLRERSE